MRIIPLEELALRWGEIAPHLKKATNRSTCYEPIDLFRIAMLEQAIIWIVERDGVIVAAAWGRVQPYPRRRILEVPFLGGKGLREWHKPMLSAIEETAKQLKCSSIMGFDRRGWAHFGFREIGVILQRDLTPA